MANHNQPGGQPGGRDVAVPDDNTANWRSPDERSERDERGPGTRYRSHGDRYAGDRGTADRYAGDRYTADRYVGRGTERMQRMQNRLGVDDASPSPGSFEDRYRDLGIDDRASHGGTWQDRIVAAGELGRERGGELDRDRAAEPYRGRDFGPERRGLTAGREERTGYPAARGRGDERLGYAAGSYGGRRTDEPMGWAARGTNQRGTGAEPAEAYGGSGVGAGAAASAGAGIDAHIHRGTGPHRGKGPAGYQRSDERLRELVCESLMDDDQLDASGIEVTVDSGEVTLSGTVEDRHAKRDAEDCACSVGGVRDVQNQLRVRASNPSADDAVVASETSAQGNKHRA